MIITLNEIKNSTIYNPGITDAQYNQYILDVEALYLQIRQKEYYQIEGTALNTTSVITGVTFKDSLKVRYLDFVDDGVNHFLIKKIEEIETNSFTITVDGTFDADYTDFIVYPRNSKRFALMAIDYLTNSVKNIGMKSERMGNHSYTLQDIDKKSGLPVEIVALVERCVSTV